MQSTFDYGLTRVREIRIVQLEPAPPGRKPEVLKLALNGTAMTPTARFWRSFFHRFGISDNVFRYFSPTEVFQRIAEVVDDHVRFCVEHPRKGGPRLLAVSNPARPLIRHGELNDLLTRYDGMDLAYGEGVISSTHRPRSGDCTFELAGDRFQHRFVMETPIDGFGHPKIYLSFLRMVCTNGAIGYARAFRSDISLGKEMDHCLRRALESFDNGDGYAALRQRFESAQSSWASVHECLQLYRPLLRLYQSARDAEAEKMGGLLKRFSKLTGNLHEMYGLANLDALSVKRQRVLPARCRVYDLINFASEVATHHVDPQGNRLMQAFIGGLISDEYDMEGTADSLTDFQDFFLESPTPKPPSVN